MVNTFVEATRRRVIHDFQLGLRHDERCFLAERDGPVFGPRKTLHNDFMRCAAISVWTDIPRLASAGRPKAGADRLLGGKAASLCLRRKRGDPAQAIGRSRGARTMKILALIDGLCRPPAFISGSRSLCPSSLTMRWS